MDNSVEVWRRGNKKEIWECFCGFLDFLSDMEFAWFDRQHELPAGPGRGKPQPPESPTGCKFAAAHTKEDALAIAAHVDSVMSIDNPLNVHLTGCHHSCAQHYIGDIGLIGAKVAVNDDGDTVPGYDIVIGGGFGAQAKIGRELRKGVKADEAPAFVVRLLRAWMAHRTSREESFQHFANRIAIAELARMVETEEALA